MATSICPGCASQVKPGDLICFTCGTNLPPGSGTEDFPVPTTIMQETLAPDQVRRAASLAMLRLAFPTGNVEVPGGRARGRGRGPGPPAPGPGPPPGRAGQAAAAVPPREGGGPGRHLAAAGP